MQQDEPEPREGDPIWLIATADDFALVDPDAPVSDARPTSCSEASNLYRNASKESEDSQRDAEARVYAMLGAVCSFYFKPGEPNEPFGPMVRFERGRSAQPSDFRGKPAEVLAAQLERITHLSVRTRVADMVWLLDRKRAGAGLIAIAGYGDIAEAITAQPEGAGQFKIPDVLRRGLQIGKALGWDKEQVVRLRGLVAKFRIDSADQQRFGAYLRLAGLDLDYQISEPALIAAEAENFAANAAPEAKNSGLHCAARAYRKAGKQVESDRCLLAAGEALVTVADAQKHSAMTEAHWLEKAIAVLRRLPNAKDRVKELKHRLVETQSRIPDEMSRFSHSEDISELVLEVRNAFSSRPLASALRSLALVSRAPSVEDLEIEARRLIAEFPLSAIVTATQYDNRGLVVHRSSGEDAFSGDGSVAVLNKIAEIERYRRSNIAAAIIEPARQIIVGEHAVSDDVVAVITAHSPFVPPDRAAVFTSGLLHFLQGDMTAALHTLVPQFENAVRGILKDLGCDVLRLNEDMTQEELGLSALFDRFRQELEECFGGNLVSDMGNVFLFRGGPQFRDRIAHGLISDWEPFHPDAIYACWLIYQLVCLPLMSHWDRIAEAID